MAADKSKIRALLGLDKPAVPTSLEPVEPELDIEGGDLESSSAAVDVSPTALVLDSWGLDRGARLLDESGILQEHKHLGEYEERALAVADFFGAAFEPEPELAPVPCECHDRGQFMRSLLETPEYRALHHDTHLDSSASEIASMAFAEQYEQMMEQRAKRHERKPPGKKGEEDPKAEAEEAFRCEMEAAAAAVKACESASEEVKDYHDARAACGMGPGSPASANPERIARFYQRVRNSAKLKRIFELAGKFRRLAQSKQRQKTAHGYDDLVGITLDNDVSHLLANELASLSHPALKMDAYRRLAEKQMMCFDYKNIEPVGAGPVIVVIDQSGSMHGNKGETAMALALAMAWIAQKQKRWCALMAYTGQNKEWIPLTGKSSQFHNLLVLPQGRWNEAEMLEWLDSFLGAGSNLDVPIREMPAVYRQIGAPNGKTDLLVISDAICHFGDDIAAPFNAWKQAEKVRMISLIIGSRGRDSGSLNAVSDEIYCMPALSLDEEGVGAALSV